MRSTCGCTDDHPFPVKCARRRELEADLCQAIREKDWGQFHAIGEQLAGPHAKVGKVAPLTQVATKDGGER